MVTSRYLHFVGGNFYSRFNACKAPRIEAIFFHLVVCLPLATTASSHITVPRFRFQLEATLKSADCSENSPCLGRDVE